MSRKEGEKLERRRHSTPISHPPPFIFLEHTAAWHGIHLWQCQTSKWDIQAGWFWLPTHPEGTHSTSLEWCVVHLPLPEIYCRLRWVVPLTSSASNRRGADGDRSTSTGARWIPSALPDLLLIYWWSRSVPGGTAWVTQCGPRGGTGTLYCCC